MYVYDKYFKNMSLIYASYNIHVKLLTPVGESEGQLLVESPHGHNGHQVDLNKMMHRIFAKNVLFDS